MALRLHRGITTISVVKYYPSKSGEYIGRGSPLGNPFVIGQHGDRDAVCDKYAEWLAAKIESKDEAVMRELRRLYKIAKAGDLQLGCFCAPLRCHGDEIKKFLGKFLD